MGLPIIQAPMAGVQGSPLAIAVSNATIRSALAEASGIPDKVSIFSTYAR